MEATKKYKLIILAVTGMALALTLAKNKK